MAEIRPIKAWRYNRDLSENIAELTSPLFDVVSRSQKDNLYNNPLNSIHLSVPSGDNPYQKAADTLKLWKKNGTLVQDKEPAIYVYYQHFLAPDNSRQYCRKGFISNIRIYDWEEGNILRHENTIPHSVKDRVKLLESTLLNTSPTHGLYSDEQYLLEKYMDESMKSPVYDTIDYQGVRDVMSIIDDPEIISKFAGVIKNRQIIMADGHHRYQSSLNFMKTQKEKNPGHTGNEAYNFHMIYLTNTESEGLRVLPTHRTVQELPDFDPEIFLDKLAEFFTIKNLDSQCDISDSIAGKKWTFGLIMKDCSYDLALKPQAFARLDWNLPPEVKELDLTVMHYFVFEKVLGIPGEDQPKSQVISYKTDFSKCFNNVMKNKAQFALITRAVSMQEIKKVCFSGYTMPQKSTYFYPKVVCGFLFSSIRESEF
jgi:uncharacterized protein (DUF1015 family)